MSNDNIKTLTNITKQLIDTKYGYSKGADMVEDQNWLKREFNRRANDRSELVAQFQSELRKIGEDAPENGTVTGHVAEGFTKFSTLFRDDAKAALSLIDDAEEKLADEIKDALEDETLSVNVRSMLTTAHAAAIQGERFADRLEDAA